MVAKAGIHLYQIMFPLGWKGPGRYNHVEVDKLMEDTVDRDRYACVIPRVSLEAPDWWLDSHPDEMCVLDDGRRKGWSFASRTWMDEVSEAFIDLVQYVRDAPYARQTNSSITAPCISLSKSTRPIHQSITLCVLWATTIGKSSTLLCSLLLESLLHSV